MSIVRAVVFDIGNVLITWNPERLFDQVMESATAREKMFSTIDLHAMNDVIDRGGNWRQTVYETAEEYPEYRDFIRLWHDRWIEMASPQIDGSVHLLRALRRKNIPVLALSNFGIETFAFARTHYPFLNEFDQKYISGHMGVIKPFPRIYEMLELGCGFEPEELLFVDDRQENVDAARIRNWSVHLFRSSADWAERLVAEGLLTESEARLEK